MKPLRNNARGSLILDRSFKGIGRLKRASGTNDPKLWRLLDAMLLTLKQAGRVDLLAALHAGTISPLELWAKFRVGELDQVPTAAAVRPLKGALEAWQAHPGREVGRWQVAARKYAIAALLKTARRGASVSDLPAVVRLYAASAAGPAMFNRTRATALAFVRDTLGRSSPLYRGVLDVPAKREVKRTGHPLDPAELKVVVTQLGPFGGMAWTMATTGMGPGEYWGRWKPLPDRLHIEGTKREGRVRDVPLVLPVVKPTLGAVAFRKRLKSVHDRPLGLYDLRRTYATLMERAGIPRTRRRIYMGHGTQDVTDLYERHEVAAYLVEDAAKLRAVLGEGPVIGARLRLA